jgi:hypothetical protein
MTPINHLPYTLGIADAKVFIGANRENWLEDASQRLRRVKFHLVISNYCRMPFSS